jgi:hypothetical protein
VLGRYDAAVFMLLREWLTARTLPRCPICRALVETRGAYCSDRCAEWQAYSM